ncbi:polysaccharide deacetylase family protein [Aquimarina sp. 2201CG5-10]|uniref:polysaccharide deacetylase family protein n=1 Tax=Aquimarina callyspongiae TaxID=3098150 RepID=UPI002AB54D02|nr:polysaccharide deacetylase family protein [Aquimarina sp. 2201CG5-10]MDY8136736.1 polysaccharide deacetylase family protein [Aquimarina sp. 2201CG5-10]
MSVLIPTKTPGIIKKIYPNYIWDLYTEESERKIYLTFDDGPIPEVTPLVLKELENHKAKATFFCIGDNIKKHPGVFKQILNDGHAIGNHTMHHLKAWDNDTKTYIEDIIDCENVILKHSDHFAQQKIFRPPYGQISISKFNEIQKLGYKIILWDILSKDWEKSLPALICKKNVITHTKPGSIVVFHDSIKASKNLISVLPEILAHFTNEGYVFDKITP